MSARPPTVLHGYRYEWQLFVDWCTASDVNPLPTSALTLVEFLGDNPAGDSVQLRRVSAINSRHRGACLPEPGRVTAIRLALDSARSTRIRHRATQLGALATALPVTGSTEALFGRRDAVLLLLAGAGMLYTAIAGLDRADIAVRDASLWIGGRHQLLIPSTPELDPGELWRRWRTVLAFSDRYPSTTLLFQHLLGDTFPDMTAVPNRAGPVAVSIDRWGHMPLPPVAMSPAAIADIVRAHATGQPPRRIIGRPLRYNDQPGSDHHPTSIAAECVSADLDPGYYTAGVAARRRAHEKLSELPSLVDDVEDRIEQLLQRTLDLLDGASITEQ
ncbi:hypothetical protein [Rhodococcus sp. H29-C3]|uniref:hypothetical protein n=1 Tax=Rhodococcus sp. H29-C3 TaxID=3046307 RepID=UPI0024BA3720|nr:hypothetical protein [Rhodococcus sp. H29-C3]MDJ0362254.1 hypothetical protein [Rhodococcus sp. H29-C3]